MKAYQIIELLGSESDREEAWSDFTEGNVIHECREIEVALKILESAVIDIENEYKSHCYKKKN